MPTKVKSNPLLTICIDATINQALPQEYVSRNNQVAEKQLVLAAHRLAKTIEMIFNPKAVEESASSFLQ